jgi:FkbM family methyltransferase
MDKCRIALSFFCQSRLCHWPGLTYYFLGWFLHQLCGIRLFEERRLYLKPFTVNADVEGKSGLMFLHEILVKRVYEDKSLAKMQNIQLLYDVGANCGFYTLIQCARDPALRVVCFEPHPETFRRLQRNLVANQLENRVTAVPAAVTAVSGVCDLNVSPESSMGIIATSTVQSLEQPKSVTVEMVSLDDYAEKQNTYPDMLKIDVEGFEADVLNGARKCLNKARSVVLEFHSELLAQQCLALLDAAQFQTTRQNNLLFAHK